MKSFRIWALCLLAALLVGPMVGRAENTAAINDVVQLKNAGMADDSIITFIRNKNLFYDLSAETILSLRDQGVSSAVLNAMLSSGKGGSTTGYTQPPTAAPGPMLQPVLPPQQPAQPILTPQQPIQQVISRPQPAPGAPPVIVAQPAFSPDAAYFYQELSPYGRWVLAEDNQWYWQPSVALTSPDWRPYWDHGNWVYTDDGWYWSSDYPWAWAAFHYGRWQLHPHHGWIWLPDRVWGPAWVTWRSGGDYCGWAPLPPGAVYDTVGGGFIFHGRRVEVGFDFGLDWIHFNFCSVRDIGERNRTRIRKEVDVRNIYRQTTIVNNYTIVKGGDHGGHVQIVNHGIDPHRVATARGRTIETIKIQDQRQPVPGGGHERMDKKNKTIEVYRPHVGDGQRR